MKLDYDCVRDILLTIEELNFCEYLHNNNVTKFKRLRDYHPNKIAYTIKKLSEAGFIPKIGIVVAISGYINFNICEMTWEGHQFLNSIRNNDVWEKTKNKSLIYGSLPVKLLVNIANKIIENNID